MNGLHSNRDSCNGRIISRDSISLGICFGSSLGGQARGDGPSPASARSIIHPAERPTAQASRHDTLEGNVNSDEIQFAAPRSAALDDAPSEPAQPVQPAGKASAELTPFMRQWTAAKRENPDALLFFRMGDFYELFYDDAVTVSRELQLTLTARDRERNQPMCGVPYHAVESYLARLLRKGYRIAICDQMEDPKLTKKIVRREVTRVLTPGTALDSALAQEQNNYLAALFETGPDWRPESIPAGAKARDKSGEPAYGLKPAPFTDGVIPQKPVKLKPAIAI